MRTVLFLFLFFYLSACTFPQEKDRIADLEKRVKDLQEQLAKQKQSANLDLQEKCAKQAQIAYKQLGWDKEALSGFENHYNAKENKCFLHIQNSDVKTTPGQVFVTGILMDAFEGKSYGEYNWLSSRTKKYWEVPPIICHVILPSGENKVCHSSDEFEELMKVHMEN